MASNRTIEDEYTEKLISDYASDCSVVRFAGTEIIDFIENRLYGSTQNEINNVLKPAADYFKVNDVDIVVLGCTHFLFLEKDLQDAFGPEIRIIDSREGVGNQIIRVLKKDGLLSDSKKKDLFILTGNQKDENIKQNYRWISEKYGLCAV